MTERVPDPLEYVTHYKMVGGGGCCVYAWHWVGNSWFEVATSVCSRDDTYDETLAESLARENAIEYRSIKLPLRPDSDRHSLTQEEFNIIVSEAIYRIGF